jgi:hypothetical protein
VIVANLEFVFDFFFKFKKCFHRHLICNLSHSLPPTIMIYNVSSFLQLTIDNSNFLRKTYITKYNTDDCISGR